MSGLGKYFRSDKQVIADVESQQVIQLSCTSSQLGNFSIEENENFIHITITKPESMIDDRVVITVGNDLYQEDARGLEVLFNWILVAAVLLFIQALYAAGKAGMFSSMISSLHA